MSKFNHTPEPWVTSMYKLPSNTIRILGPLNKYETKSEWVGDLIGAKSLNHNAERIVACVNHCKGATNEELEATSYEQMQERLKEAFLGVDQMQNMSTGIAKQFHELKAQRDELLAALELAQQIILDQNAGYKHERESIALAISNAKGGQQ